MRLLFALCLLFACGGAAVKADPGVSITSPAPDAKIPENSSFVIEVSVTLAPGETIEATTIRSIGAVITGYDAQVVNTKNGNTTLYLCGTVGAQGVDGTHAIFVSLASDKKVNQQITIYAVK